MFQFIQYFMPETSSLFKNLLVVAGHDDRADDHIGLRRRLHRLLFGAESFQFGGRRVTPDDQDENEGRG
jgi:hypothetical protein